MGTFASKEVVDKVYRDIELQWRPAIGGMVGVRVRILDKTTVIISRPATSGPAQIDPFQEAPCQECQNC